MYSGVLERVYKAKQAETSMPDYFLDLNLNQIVKELQEKGKGYDIRSMFYRLPSDYETVCYRREIYREIRNKKLESMFAAFSKHMRETRRYTERMERAEEKQQQQMFYYNAVSEFVEGVFLVRDVLSAVKPESEGLAGLLGYVEDFCCRPLWQECKEAMNRIGKLLSDLCFQLTIDGANLKVRSGWRERYYFDQIKKLFPERFSEKKDKYGVPEDYFIASPFQNLEQLGYLETEIVKMYRKKRPDFFKELVKFQKKFKKMIDEDMYRVEEEVQYYLVYGAFQKDMEGRGCVFCEPQVKQGDVFLVHQVYDLALARKNRRTEKEVVSNSVQYREGERFFVVTGPNQGGKTTFARSLGQLVYFAMMGLDVPAESAVLPYFEGLLTHFSVEESLESGRGRLKEELVRLAPMMQESAANRFVIFNELFTTAATYDAFVMGQRVLQHFIGQKCLGVYVTHVAELAKAGEGAVSLVALADETDHRRRTFQVVRKEAEGIGYAGDIVEKHRLGYEELCKRLEEGGIV